MDRLRILIVVERLNTRTGTETHTRDLAVELLRRGHTPIVYSPLLGEVAHEIRAHGISVTDSLNTLAAKPDIIHGNHNLETFAALLRFPGLPAVFFYHHYAVRSAAPPLLPRVLRYAAVDQPRSDQLIFEYGIEEGRVRLFHNAVDLARFKPRVAPLPPQPKRALVFLSCLPDHVGAVRAACARRGIEVDVIGAHVGNECAAPEEILGHYDLVFAKGRCAIEALVTGAAVIVSQPFGFGPMVTTAELDELRDANFGRRAVRHPVQADAVEQEILRYDAADAAEVSRRMRRVAGQAGQVDSILELYEEAIEEFARAGRPDPEAEARAAADYLRWLSLRLHAEARPLPRLVAERLRNRLRRLPLARRMIGIPGEPKSVF
jgi:hypothetical protein